MGEGKPGLSFPAAHVSAYLSAVHSSTTGTRVETIADGDATYIGRYVCTRFEAGATPQQLIVQVQQNSGFSPAAYRELMTDAVNNMCPKYRASL